MPYTASQHKLFQAAAHNPQIAAKHGMSQQKAAEMASEGVKHQQRRHLAKMLRGR